ncbi:cytochrome B5-like protein isoform X3 [Malania oleifera]|uniref:cytochrome B5-like protein isoform X3 n=1 Tax=Malania oleifera TaxID=397392 RepID=UPI0025AEBD2E|nr:cytochrome B5-like protein isoform X3 [Malania oleifera]
MVILAVTLILCVLLGFLLLIPGRRKYDLAKEAQSSANDYKVKESKMITRAEVSLHNRRNDCWIIIKNKVEMPFWHTLGMIQLKGFTGLSMLLEYLI